MRPPLAAAVALLALLAAPGYSAQLCWGFETGTEGWTKWSTVPMAQEVRSRPAHSGRGALWGELREPGPLVHSRDGLDVAVNGNRLSFWYYVPREATFRLLEINVRTHQGGERLYQTARGLRKGRWQRIEIPLEGFFGWVDRASGSLRLRQFEVTAAGTGALVLDDVTLTTDPAPASPNLGPGVLAAPGRDGLATPPGAWSYFRRRVSLASVPRWAWLQVGGDEEASVWANGHWLGKTGMNPACYDLSPWLRVGENVLAVAILNHGTAPNPSGMVAAAKLGDEVLLSDTSWLAAAKAAEGWQEPGFNDSSWQPAQITCRVPAPPWGALAIYPFSIPADPDRVAVSLAATDDRVVATLASEPASCGEWKAEVRALDEALSGPVVRRLRATRTAGETRLDLGPTKGLAGAVEVHISGEGLAPTRRILWVPEARPPRCERHSALTRPARGAIRTARVGDRWFLVDAQGNLFHSLACNATMHVAYWSQAYDSTVREGYAGEGDWAQTCCARLQALGFNSSAGGLVEEHRQRNMPFFAGRCLSWAGPHLQDGEGHSIVFPDVFDPRWREGAEQWVREDVDAYGDDPLLAGWWTDNEIWMHQPLSHDLGLMGWFWSPATSAELSRWLSERYGGDIAALNRKWTSDQHTYAYAGFGDLATDKPVIRGEGDPVAPDLEAFVRHILETYVNVITGLYRRYDGRHPVCSNRFAGQFDVRLADVLRPYDIIACNSYPRDTWDQREFSAGQLEWLRAMHQATGRPVLISEWSVMAVDSGLPNGWGRLDSQGARAEAYGRVLGQLWDEKYIIGSHWFSWVDSTDAEAANFGIVDAHDRLYEPLARAMRQANAQYEARLAKWAPWPAGR